MFRRQANLIQCFKDVIYCFLLLLSTFIDIFLKKLMLLNKSTFQLIHILVDLLLNDVVFGPILGGIKNICILWTDFFCFLVEVVDGSFDGGQVKELLIFDYTLIWVLFGYSLYFGYHELFQLIDLLPNIRNI